MDLLERRRMMMAADGGWKTYALTNHTFPASTGHEIDTGIALYQMSEWELEAVFTVTGVSSGEGYPLHLQAWSNMPTVSMSSVLVRLGSVNQQQNAIGETLTLVASWKAGIGGTATLAGENVNLANTMAGNLSLTNTLLLFHVSNSRRYISGTIHSLTIRYKE